MNHSLYRQKLNSGAELLIINLPGAKTISFDTIVRAGFQYASRSKYELPHLLEHLAFLGNKYYENDEIFAYEIEKRGAYCNASTYQNFIRYYFEAPNEELEAVIKLAMAQINSPKFRDEDILAQKAVINTELSRRMDSESDLLSEKLFSKIEKEFVMLNKRTKLLDTIQKSDIQAYFNQTHVTNNLWLLVCGDITNQRRQTIVEQLNTLLSDLPKGQRLPIKKINLLDYKKKIITKTSMYKKQAYFNFNFISEEYDPKDYMSYRIFGAIYNSGIGSRMFLRTRNAGLSYGLSTSWELDNNYSIFSIRDSIPTEKLLDSLKLALVEFISIRKGDFSDDELERAKGYVYGSLRRSYEVAPDYSGWYGPEFALGETLVNLEEYIESAKAVTKHDVVNVAKKYIDPESWIFGVASTNHREVGEQARQIISALL